MVAIIFSPAVHYNDITFYKILSQLLIKQANKIINKLFLINFVHLFFDNTILSGEIITGNYELVYYVAENVGIIGILAYPKSVSY